jgi:hypothetical protein
MNINEEGEVAPNCTCHTSMVSLRRTKTSRPGIKDSSFFTAMEKKT